MKQLLLLRHGEALRGTADQSDHQRALSERGKQEARNTGAWLASQHLLPDYILCSTALRARQTLEALGLPEGILSATRLTDALYLASPGELLQNLQSLPEYATRLLLIGHNPGLQDFCEMFAPAGDAAARDSLALGYRTAAVAGITFEIEQWQDVPSEGGFLNFYREPE